MQVCITSVHVHFKVLYAFMGAIYDLVDGVLLHKTLDALLETILVIHPCTLLPQMVDWKLFNSLSKMQWKKIQEIILQILHYTLPQRMAT